MIVRSFFIRPALKNPLRYIITLLGVAIGVASIISTLLASQAAIRSMHEGIEEISGKTKLIVTQPAGVPANVLGELRSLSRYARLTPIIDEIVMLPKLDDTIRVLGLDFFGDQEFREINWNDIETLKTNDDDEVAFAKALKGEGVILSKSLAENLDLSVGDEITFSILAKRKILEIVGIFTPPRFSSAWDHVAVIDVGYAQSLFNKPNSIDRIEIFPYEQFSVNFIEYKINSLLSHEYQILTPNERKEQTERMFKALQFNLTALSGISLIVGGVLVAITLYTSVIQRRYVISLLRSLGASKFQIRRAVLIEALSIGLLGGLLGVLAGYWGAQISLASVRSTMAVIVQGIPQSEVELTNSMILLGTILGLLVSGLASFGALREAVATPPLQGLHSEKPIALYPFPSTKWVYASIVSIILAWLMTLLPAYNDLPYAALLSSLLVFAAFAFITLPLLDLVARLLPKLGIRPGIQLLHVALVTLYSSRKRAAWAGSAICFAAGLAIAMTCMITSFRQTVIDWTNQAMQSDIWIRPVTSSTGVPVGKLDPEMLQYLIDRFGTKQIDPFFESEAIYRDQTISLGAGDFQGARSEYNGFPFISGKPSTEIFQQASKENGVMVNEPFSRRFNVQAGDELKLNVYNQTITRPITGVFYDYSNHEGLVVMDYRDYLNFYPSDSPRGIAIYLKPDENPREIRESLRQEFSQKWRVDIMLQGELRQEILRVFDQTFAITQALQIIASFVAGLAVLTVLFAIVNERKRDLALIRALGGSRRQIVTVVLIKALFLGLVGIMGGILAGLAVGWILVEIVNLQSFRWSLQMIYPWQAIFQLTGWILLFSLLVGWLPAWHTSRMSIQEALRTDE